MAKLSEQRYLTLTDMLADNLKAAHITFLFTPDIMSAYVGDRSRNKTYSDFIEHCLLEREQTPLHWNHHFGQFILAEALDALGGIGCHIKPAIVTPLYFALQKHVGTCCYKCASTAHTNKTCPQSSLTCNHCSKKGHVEQVCSYRYLPCSHCGRIGHFRGHRNLCPHFKTVAESLHSMSLTSAQ
jgi:hypothetical protein